jgi:hypothetical protein
MVIDDESLLFTGKEETGRGITVWIPTERNIVIDFTQDSRVYVLGKTTRGKAIDPITRQPTDEPGDVMLNAYGIYCPELFKVKASVKPVTAETLSPLPTEAEPVGEEESPSNGDW